MKKISGIPRILAIESVEDFVVTMVFNNGEYRQLNFQALFERWEFGRDPFRAQLLQPGLFASLTLRAGTLCWPALTLSMTLSNGLSFESPFELDPVVLYEESIPAASNTSEAVGNLIRETRQQLGLTQQELALRSGTTRHYISRIENNRSDIELGTLRKIVEVGLGKQLRLEIG